MRVTVTTLILCLLFTIPIAAESLWDDKAADMYKDDIARDIGDLVTIIIVEKSSASQKASTETSQETAVDAGPGLGIFDFVKTFSFDYSDENGADGSTVREGLLNARITAQIIDKQPNGNLIVQGLKSIKINGEKQEIQITGVIRQKDVKPDNTVESTYMADVEIGYSGEGTVGDKQKPGLFERLFNWLF